MPDAAQSRPELPRVVWRFFGAQYMGAHFSVQCVVSIHEGSVHTPPMIIGCHPLGPVSPLHSRQWSVWFPKQSGLQGGGLVLLGLTRPHVIFFTESHFSPFPLSSPALMAGPTSFVGGRLRQSAAQNQHPFDMLALALHTSSEPGPRSTTALGFPCSAWCKM